MDVNFKSLSFEKSEAEPEVEENMHFLKSLQVYISTVLCCVIIWY